MRVWWSWFRWRFFTPDRNPHLSGKLYRAFVRPPKKAAGR